MTGPQEIISLYDRYVMPTYGRPAWPDRASNSDQATRGCSGDGGSAGRGVQLSKDIRHMPMGRVGADHQALCDLSVRDALCEQAEYLELPSRQQTILRAGPPKRIEELPAAGALAGRLISAAEGVEHLSQLDPDGGRLIRC